jgi:hypothetical protein
VCADVCLHDIFDSGIFDNIFSQEIPVNIEMFRGVEIESE